MSQTIRRAGEVELRVRRPLFSELSLAFKESKVLGTAMITPASGTEAWGTTWMDRGSWQVTVFGVAKQSETTARLNNKLLFSIYHC